MCLVVVKLRTHRITFPSLNISICLKTDERILEHDSVNTVKK